MRELENMTAAWELFKNSSAPAGDRQFQAKTVSRNGMRAIILPKKEEVLPQEKNRCQISYGEGAEEGASAYLFPVISDNQSK